MKKFAVVARLDEESYQLKQHIVQYLTDNGFVEDQISPKTVFVVGGDGTFLYAVHHYLKLLDQIHFIGIHTGTLGFMNDYHQDEVELMLHDFLHKDPHIDCNRLLEIIVEGKKEPYYAMNEMRIENPFKTQILDIFIDSVFFETFRGTGICLATQMGSTAYNRSIKGAVIQHGLSLLELSEIAGIHHREFQSLGNSIILKESTEIELICDNFQGAILCYDHCFEQLDMAKRILCRNSKKEVQIVRYRPYHYLSRLKNLF